MNSTYNPSLGHYAFTTTTALTTIIGAGFYQDLKAELQGMVHHEDRLLSGNTRLENARCTIECSLEDCVPSLVLGLIMGATVGAGFEYLG